MITSLPLWLIFSLLNQGVVPLKPPSEYEIIIDYKFQERPPANRDKVNYDLSSQRNIKSSGPLPYLKLQINLLRLGIEEVKVKVVNNDGNQVLNRKATLETVIKLDLGFIDDVKDRISPHEFTVLFYSDSKLPVSQIRLSILEDGTFLVNDEKKGNF